MNAIYEELTAREMLHLLATLRGIRDPQDHVEKWISILGWYPSHKFKCRNLHNVDLFSILSFIVNFVFFLFTGVYLNLTKTIFDKA